VRSFGWVRISLLASRQNAAAGGLSVCGGAGGFTRVVTLEKLAIGCGLGFRITRDCGSNDEPFAGLTYLAPTIIAKLGREVAWAISSRSLNSIGPNFWRLGMSTSADIKSKRQRGYVPTTALAKLVEFDDVMMRVTFMDGRVLSVPLAWFPSLSNATPEQRGCYEIGDGVAGRRTPSNSPLCKGENLSVCACRIMLQS
jgi:Protein of unknown function (DUF2442)